MRNKSVSVVLPYIASAPEVQMERCLNSLFNQTILPNEIILVGEERVWSFLSKREYKNKRKIIRMIIKKLDKNQARNEGILNSKYDYILYMDHDMWADKSLIEKCFKLLDKVDAIIIPEDLLGGSFWENCKRLEKKLIKYDIHSVTPRFYRKSIFSKNEKPFDMRFGLLDEWGFNHKLLKKDIKVGFVNSYFVIKKDSFNLWVTIVNKYQRGLWMRNFWNIDKGEAWNRVNPISRGLVFYATRIKYLFKEPVYFLGVIFLKIVDLSAFMVGYFMGFFLINNTAKSRKNPKDHKSPLL